MGLWLKLSQIFLEGTVNKFIAADSKAQLRQVSGAVSTGLVVHLQQLWGMVQEETIG